MWVAFEEMIFLKEKSIFTRFLNSFIFYYSCLLFLHLLVVKISFRIVVSWYCNQ